MHAELFLDFSGPRAPAPATSLRRSGLDAVGDVPWGTHFCQFYATADDLLETLAPYFAAGLEANELCLWVTSEPLSVAAAKAGLSRLVPDLDRHLASGQLEILDYEDWYLGPNGFDADRVLQGWLGKLEDALRRGYDGLRLTGNTFWLEKDDWGEFARYEAEVCRALSAKRILALCTYSLEKCGAPEILDVVAHHEIALIRRGGRWESIKSLAYHRAEKALNESEERFRLLVQNVRDYAIFMLDQQGRIVSWNDGAERIEGWSAQEIVGRHFSVLHPAQSRDRQSLQRELDIAAANGLFKEEGERLRKDGSLFHADVLITPLRDEEGRLRGYAKVIRDVTERKLAERQFLANEARLRATIEGAVDAIVTIDETGAMLSLNTSALRLFGYQLGEALGRNVRMLMPEPYCSEHDRYLAEYRLTGQRALLQGARELVGRRKDGATFPIEIALSEASHDGNRLFIAFIRDLTERRKTEERIQQLRADRLDLLAQMATGVAHEVNQPLSAIANYLSAARRLLNKRPEAMADRIEEVLDSAAAQVMRAGQIIGQLRAFITSSEPDKTLQNLHDLIVEACEFMRTESQNANVEVECRLNAPSDLVILDKVQVRQVLINLKRNAIEAMLASERRRLVVTTTLVEGGMIRTDVADTGAGLSGDFARDLFEPFETTKEHGLGVGLSVSRSIVEAHYGKLWAEPNPYGGAVLSFTLPLADENAVAAARDIDGVCGVARATPHISLE